MMCLVVADVTGRYVFNKPVKGALEIDEIMMAFVVFLSLAYCTVKKGHIIVELLLGRLQPRTQSILNGFSCIIGAVIFSIITWQTGLHGWRELFSPTGTITMLLGIPVAPFFMVAAFGFALMCLVLLFQSYRFFSGTKAASEITDKVGHGAGSEGG
jgi:TRAP-type transport system small permease protein